MARWQVELTGNRFDLEDLPGWFTDPAFRVVEVDGSYFLEAAKLETLGSSSDVHRAARSLIEGINGVAQLHSSSFRDVGLGSHVREVTGDDGPRHHAVILADTLEVRAKVGAVIVKPDGTDPAPPIPGSQLTDRWMSTSRSDPDAGEAIALWSGTHDWVRLYKIYEIVRSRADIVRAGWATTAELTLFKRTANHQDAAGMEARHARMGQDAPSPPDDSPRSGRAPLPDPHVMVDRPGTRARSLTPARRHPSTEGSFFSPRSSGRS